MMEKCADVGSVLTKIDGKEELVPITGCDYVELGSYVKEGKMWTELKCTKCGDLSVGWQPL